MCLPRFVRRTSPVLLTLLLLGFPKPAHTAPSPIETPPFHVTAAGTGASVHHEGTIDALVVNLPVDMADRLETLDVAATLSTPDGGVVVLAPRTTLEILGATHLHLIAGRVLLDLTRIHRSTAVWTVSAPTAEVHCDAPASLTVDATPDEVELRVLHGVAEITTADGGTTVHAGERAWAAPGLAPSFAEPVNDTAAFGTAPADPYVPEAADDGLVEDGDLPASIRLYAPVLARHGSWRTDPIVGRVWSPSVHPGWRPYQHGFWRLDHRRGRTWIGSDVWSWPTDHYGRWGFSQTLGWYWQPASQWGPGWVAWSLAPGYVAWCPIGRNGRPVFGLFGNAGTLAGSTTSPWTGWIVVPRHAFDHARPVHDAFVDARRLDRSTRLAFVSLPAAPAPVTRRARPGAMPMPPVRTDRHAGSAHRSTTGTMSPLAAVASTDSLARSDSSAPAVPDPRGASGRRPSPQPVPPPRALIQSAPRPANDWPWSAVPMAAPRYTHGPTERPSQETDTTGRDRTPGDDLAGHQSGTGARLPSRSRVSPAPASFDADGPASWHNNGESDHRPPTPGASGLPPRASDPGKRTPRRDDDNETTAVTSAPGASGNTSRLRRADDAASPTHGARVPPGASGVPDRSAAPRTAPAPSIPHRPGASGRPGGMAAATPRYNSGTSGLDDAVRSGPASTSRPRTR